MSALSPSQEVVVTGIGVVTPIEGGSGMRDFWNGLCSGVDAIKPIRGFDVSGHRCCVGGEVLGFEAFLEDRWQQGYDRSAKLFALAVRYALEDAAFGCCRKETVGLSVGTILGGIASGERYMNDKFFLSRSPDKGLLKQYSLHSAADSIARKYSLSGPVISINTACCSGADAIRAAAEQIKTGRADIMIAGGVDMLSEFVFRGFSALNALTTDGKVRPFDKRRTGLALGEGAGTVVLEEKAHALARGARIYCALAGAGSSSDAYNMVRPNKDGDGLSRAIIAALCAAESAAGAVDYICAHGTGTQYNDSTETKAIKRAFKDDAFKVRISSIKSMIGHTLGASSAIEAVTCIKAIETGMIPPTIHYAEPDPDCDLSYVVNTALKREVKTCISLSAGFGGQNTALVFKRVTC
ncbi:MAG: beta-ketoacyl-[acyl-carrier-protein] synthase family protein [Candidatus Omnitrophota bacterium]